MNALIVLDGSDVPGEQVGGKGAALNRLIATGVTVPATGVITSDAYHRFIGESGLSSYLDELRASPPPAPADLDRAAAEVDAAFLEAPMSAQFETEILDLAHQIMGDGQLAIRSSATAEDLESASFAGQYRSLLEIDLDDRIIEAVRLVWSSLWLPAPRAYRTHAGVDDQDLAMAVVVMRLVDAKRAGVVFTVNPSGDGSDLRVEAVDGLAEALVSGEVTPDAWNLSRSGPRRPTVDPVIDEVVQAALSIERRFDAPQDVEWAHDGQRLWIVQARPITTLVPAAKVDGFDTVIGPDDSYTTAGIGEMLPGVLSPLVWTSVRAPLDEAFRRLFDGLDALPPEADVAPFIARIRGRAVLHLDLLKAAARQVPGGSAAEIERQYFGRVLTENENDEVEARGPFKALRTMFAGVREIQARRAYRDDAELVVEAIDRLAHQPPDCHIMSNDELLRYRHRVLDLAGRAFAAEVAVAAAAANAYRGVELFLTQHIGDRAPALAQQLTAGGIDPCGAQLALQTCSIAAQALEGDELRRLATNATSSEQFRSALTTTSSGARLRELVDAELAHAGSASVFAGATWGESDELAWNLIVQAITTEARGRREMVTPQDRLDQLAEVEAEFTTSRKYRLQRVMTGQIVDVRKRMLHRLVFDAVEFLHLRERTKSAVLLLGGELRRIHLALGHRLHGEGGLENPLAIDLLSAAELEAAFDDAAPSAWEIDRRRRALAHLEEQPSLPQLFTGDPSRARGTVGTDSDHFTGWAASGGTYEGTARVITKASEPLEPGDILVARTTDPAWTPLFLTAGAIVVEEGGPLSHAAIIAREFQLPAVLNVPGLIERLAGRDRISLHVDGDEGTVTILDLDTTADPDAALTAEVNA